MLIFKIERIFSPYINLIWNPLEIIENVRWNSSSCNASITRTTKNDPCLGVNTMRLMIQMGVEHET